MSLFGTRKKAQPEIATIVVDGRDIAVTLKRNARARQMILRPDPSGNGATVTLPPGASAASGIAFAEERALWLAQQFLRYDETVPFEEGAFIPYLGVDHEIRQSAARRGSVVQDEGVLYVSGQPEHLARRLTDWMKAQARQAITDLADEKLTVLDVKRGRISIRDTRSRWGSCSSTGALNFSWRLVMAPEWVLDYVVAHEVAHLVEHNHSPAFWAVVDIVTDHTRPAKKWLTDNGGQLHRYG
jgi:predicted metal-dependent hydrolase